jgi:hypothetical protein
MSESFSVGAISVVIDQPVIHAGCESTGKVYLSVYVDELNFGSICGRIIGQETADVSYYVSNLDGEILDTHIAHDAWTFMDTSFLISDTPETVVQRGQYEFPFSFTMPASAPATTYTGILRSSASISYTIEV